MDGRVIPRYFRGMPRRPSEIADAAYRLRHRLRSIGEAIDEIGPLGPVVTVPHAAFALAVDPSRVRALIDAGRVESVRVAGGRFEYVRASSLLNAPTVLETGRPFVRRSDGSRVRDGEQGADLVLPLRMDAAYWDRDEDRPRKNRGRSPGRNA